MDAPNSDACRAAEYLCSARNGYGHPYRDGGCEDCHAYIARLVDKEAATSMTLVAIIAREVPEVSHG